MNPDLPHILFVTGRLAEFALRQVLEGLAPRAGFVPEVAVLPISVAALIARKFQTVEASEVVPRAAHAAWRMNRRREISMIIFR